MASGETQTHRRRTFFREAFSRMLAPLADRIGRGRDHPTSPPRLRPPGAMAESQLVDTCYRCGGCVEVCPADAIFPLVNTEGDAAGTPAIDPDETACVLCEGLKCTAACPSGALTLVTEPGAVRMGLAEIYHPLCARTNGDDCTRCFDWCPLGEAAIRLEQDGPPEILSPGCVGCGMCQLHCPTGPKAIVVRPLM